MTNFKFWKLGKFPPIYNSFSYTVAFRKACLAAVCLAFTGNLLALFTWIMWILNISTNLVAKILHVLTMALLGIAGKTLPQYYNTLFCKLNSIKIPFVDRNIYFQFVCTFKFVNFFFLSVFWISIAIIVFVSKDKTTMEETVPSLG